MVSMLAEESFLNINTNADFIYIDAPVAQICAVRRKLEQCSQEGGPLIPKSWDQGTRSRGWNIKFPREVIIGQISTNCLAARAATRYIIEIFESTAPELEVMVGRQSTFGDANAILYEGSPLQLQKIKDILRQPLGEIVVVSAFKSIFLPYTDATVIKGVLTDNEDLENTIFRYRKSGPSRGAVFVQASVLPEHAAAKKK